MSASNRKGFTGRIERGPMAADVFRQNFTQIFNLALRDKRLSRRARGLMGEILSHSDGFGVSMASLLANGPEGKDALTVALKELEQYGYLHRGRERNELGHLGDTIFKITDMPNGLLLGAEAPWQTSEDPQTQNRRSEPKTENPPQADGTQNRRSEPKTDFPAQAEPAQAEPPHKKNNSSCGAEEALSPVRHAGLTSGGERELATPQDADADVVVDAYVEALGRPLLNGSRKQLRKQASQLLAAGYPVEWLAARAAEMPANGWKNLIQHAEASRVPIPGQTGTAQHATPGGGRKATAAEVQALRERIAAQGSGL